MKTKLQATDATYAVKGVNEHGTKIIDVFADDGTQVGQILNASHRGRGKHASWDFTAKGHYVRTTIYHDNQRDALARFGLTRTNVR